MSEAEAATVYEYKRRQRQRRIEPNQISHAALPLDANKSPFEILIRTGAV